MKKIVEKVRTHRKVVHAHLKKHHKKYFFGLLSAALLIKIIPAMIAWFATMHFNYMFANDNASVTDQSESPQENPLNDNGWEENEWWNNGWEENEWWNNGWEENEWWNNGWEEDEW